jgi:hypothetical protein
MKTLITLLLFTGLLHAQELKQGEIKRDRQKFAQLATRTGITYKDVEVSKVSAIDLRIMHTGGFATVPLADLPADVQQLFGYDPLDADAAMKNAQAQRAQDLIKAEQDKAAHAALLLKQQQEHKAIKDIEAEGFMAEVLAEEKLPEGCLCRMWSLTTEAVKGQKNFSGEPITRVVLGRQYSVFIPGLSLGSGQRQQLRVYPVSVKDRHGRDVYATTANASFRLAAEEAAQIEAEKAAKLAEAEARIKAARAAREAALAARSAK